MTQLLDYDSYIIREVAVNEVFIKSIKKKFKQLNDKNAQILLRHLLTKSTNISLDIFSKGRKRIYQYNMSKFEKISEDSEKFVLKNDVVDELLLELDSLIRECYLDKDELESNEEYEKNKDLKEIVQTINNKTYYEKIRKDICDDTETIFKYDFDNPDMKTSHPKNVTTLQRCNIHIVSMPIVFHYSLKYKYHCSFCQHNMEKYPYEVVSTNNKVKCEGTITNQNTGNVSICKTSLSPDEPISLTKNGYFYDINYEDELGIKYSGTAISFKKLEPGFYNSVLFNIRVLNKTNFFHIMDVQDIKTNPFQFPENKKDEHYLITLVKAFDEYIKQQTGVEIYGLYPIKIALIIQKLYSVLGFTLHGNIQIVGDPSTGKSLILKYYGFLLNSTFNLSTNGLSVSVPGMRGTYHKIDVLGKESKVVTTGHLGTYTSIHIDEAGENRELIQNLKPFLLDDNYSYDKAGGMGISNKRTAHVNLSENLDHTHVGQYRGAIRKTYKEINYKIGDEEKEEWNENWDLHLPIFMYHNPYLRKVVREKRLEYMQKQTFWIDGYVYALHERFPFYFYLITEKENQKLNAIIKENRKRNTISENIALIRALKSDDITGFFSRIKNIEEDDDKNVQAYEKVDEIIKSYGFVFDVRTKSFFYQLVRTCKIINMQDDYTEDDFNIIRYFLETTNRKIDVVDTQEFKVSGPPDTIEERKIDEKLEEVGNTDDEFGLQDGEFDDF